MLRSVLAFSAVTAFLAAVTGCGVNRFERREAWRDHAENACISRGLVRPTAWVSLSQEISGPGPCGMQQPFRVTRLAGGAVSLKQRLTLACPALAEAEAWLAETIQPAANLYFGVAVAEINAGSYACRGRNNRVGAKLSEHSFGNALDIMSFTLADGYVVTIKGGWRGTPAEQGFLREVFTGACARFSTVLGPGSDMFHYDHFHVDLARHDPRGMRRVCKPLLNYVSQLGAGGGMAALATPRPPVRQPAPEQPSYELEEDPYAAAPSAARGGPAFARAQAPRPEVSTYAAPSAARAPRAGYPQPGYSEPPPGFEDDQAALGPPNDGSEPIY